MRTVKKWLPPLAALLLLAVASAQAAQVEAQRVPPAVEPLKIQGNPVANTRVYSEGRMLMVHQAIPEQIPEVTWWADASQGPHTDPLHLHGIYSDWTVDIIWNSGEPAPDVQIQYLPPPDPRP